MKRVSIRRNLERDRFVEVVEEFEVVVEEVGDEVVDVDVVGVVT